MRRFRFPLLMASMVVFAGAVPPSTTAYADTQPAVIRDMEAGKDVLTAKAPEQPDTTIEPSIAVNPADPLNVVSVYQMGRVDGGGDGDNGFATSKDGGKTWTYGALPGLTKESGGKFDRASDAVVAFGPNNTVYADSLVFNDVTGSGLESGVAVNVSTDGGLTWGQPTFPDDDMLDGLNDKNWVVVDNGTGTGHHTGRIYTVWDRTLAEVVLSYSDDQGKTWSQPQPVYAGEGIGAIPLVLPDGSLAVVFDTIQPQSPLPALSSDPNDVEQEATSTSDKLVVALAPGAGLIQGGAPLAFAPPTTVATYQGNSILGQRAGSLPAAAVDPKSGAIYVAWESARFRTDGANDIVVRSSTTDGATWGPVVRVNPGPANDSVDHYNAMIDVGTDGVVRVGYRQTDESSGDVGTVDTYFQQSSDAGKTWSSPLKVNSVQSDPAWGAFSRGGLFQGDYNELAAAGSWTYIVRCESYNPALMNETPMSNRYHQTTWVAVVGPAGSTAP